VNGGRKSKYVRRAASSLYGSAVSIVGWDGDGAMEDEGGGATRVNSGRRYSTYHTYSLTYSGRGDALSKRWTQDRNGPHEVPPLHPHAFPQLPRRLLRDGLSVRLNLVTWRRQAEDRFNWRCGVWHSRAPSSVANANVPSRRPATTSALTLGAPSRVRTLVYSGESALSETDIHPPESSTDKVCFLRLHSLLDLVHGNPLCRRQ
jgi:hypothetical protein